MKQHYFYSLFFIFFFTVFGSQAQNNAINLSTSSIFTISGLNGYPPFPLNITTFTFEYDFYLNAASNGNARFLCAPGVTTVAKPIEFYVDASGVSVLKLGDGTTFETIGGTPSFTVGQWYHVTFVVNNTATKNIKMYVNGIQVLDSVFTQPIEFQDNSNYTRINLGSFSTTNNCKFDNLRIWNDLRTSTEIFDNYTSCVSNTEQGLELDMNFDGSNNGVILNRAVNSTYKYASASGNFSFVPGAGCSTPPAHPPITVTGSYAGKYYYTGEVNGRPRYATDNDLDCSFFTAESSCTLPESYEIVWDNTKWVLKQVGCFWMFTSCEDVDNYDPGIYATNAANLSFGPCDGWVYTDTNASSTFSSEECAALSTDNFTSNELLVYPNPSKNSFTLNFNETLKVEIFDVLGQSIYSSNLTVGANSIDFSHYSKGVYILRAVTTNGNVKTIRLIKE
ncbi:T9SS type A sorting domain-containing protein [Flavobacterium amnicola]|uniref:T9SS type A sorting domain-containing protein n=1 Tax=Flavobacterium amnicola TaxID=2506422 RepID=A0A4Q1K5D3_9FLAO|nr:LamG-like jellyroll fold domain-containing protein [Flavobacterium amnicola]RXR20998.1 T9SS type A sorting domain-containing protein [Flavobacterium amnicola]